MVMFSPRFAAALARSSASITLGFFALVADVLLVQEADGLEVLRELALDGSLAGVLRDVLGLGLVDRPLGGEVLLRHLVGADEARLQGRDGAISWTNSRNSSVRATKSVSQFTSTSTPTRPPAWM